MTDHTLLTADITASEGECATGTTSRSAGKRWLALSAIAACMVVASVAYLYTPAGPPPAGGAARTIAPDFLVGLQSSCIESCSSSSDCASDAMCAGGNGAQTCDTCKKVECNKLKDAPTHKQSSGSSYKINVDSGQVCACEDGSCSDGVHICSCNGD